MNKKASEYFNDRKQSSMTELLHMLHQYNKTAALLYPHLSKEMQEHCVFSNIHNDTITYLTTLSGAANIIRFQIPEIVLRIQNLPEFKHIKKIHCKVMHAFKNRIEMESPTQKKIPVISEKNSQLILEYAEYIEDEDLRNSLIRLSKHTK